MPAALHPPLGSMPVLQFCTPAQLQIDATYQRPTDAQQSRTLIGRIARGWDWRLFQPEGACSPTFGLEPETLERLADALKMAIEVEAPFTKARDDIDGRELLEHLHVACSRFLEGWA